MDYFTPALIYGVGILTGVILKKYIFVGQLEQNGRGSVSRVARLAAIRAKNLGRNHKMVFVVRNDLGMGKGKIAAQCSHAAVMCYQNAQNSDPVNLDIWEATGQTKICIKCDGGEEELKILQRKAKAIGVVNALVRDAGHTQVHKVYYGYLNSLSSVRPFSANFRHLCPLY